MVCIDRRTMDFPCEGPPTLDPAHGLNAERRHAPLPDRAVNTSSVALELRGVGAGVTGFDATYPSPAAGEWRDVCRGVRTRPCRL